MRLTDGRVLAEDAVVWLPPVQPGTIFALGLNYADHAKELAFKAPDEPLVFLKGPQSVCGHRGQTRRPRGVTNHAQGGRQEPGFRELAGAKDRT